MIVIILIFSSYFLALLALLISFRRLKNPTVLPTQSTLRFSIVIPFRNEAKNLPGLLDSLSQITYPLSQFEILLVDDASTDDSVAIITKFAETSDLNLRILRSIPRTKAPKKDAILTAIEQAQFEWVLTTDADCVVPKKWLECYATQIQVTDSMMICGPILYANTGKFILKFQHFDGLSMQTVTIGSIGLGVPLLANGGNLGFRKDGFWSVNGFEGNTHLSSGDDIFLMEKFRSAFPRKITFLKTSEALVVTQGQTTWRDLLSQRVRWLSKTSQQKNRFSTLLGIVVFVTNLMVLLLPIGMILFPKNVVILLFFGLSKFAFDAIFVQQSAKLYGQTLPLGWFLLSFLIYPWGLLLVSLRSVRGNFDWKGRNYVKQ